MASETAFFEQKNQVEKTCYNLGAILWQDEDYRQDIDLPWDKV